jgi:hypothetical protein
MNRQHEERAAMTTQTPDLAALVGGLEKVERKKRSLPLGKRSCAVATVVFLILIAGESPWAAEKIVPGLFKNTAEVIGWLKAKGACKRSGVIVTCDAEIQLSTKDREGKEISPGWRMDGSWQLVEVGAYQTALSVRINRSRELTLSPKDPLALMAVQNASFIEFGSDGIMAESYQKLWMSNYKGENIFSLTIPWRKGAGPLETLGEDFFLLTNAFGVGWNFLARAAMTLPTPHLAVVVVILLTGNPSAARESGLGWRNVLYNV